MDGFAYNLAQQNELMLLTLSAHAQEGYSSAFSVCLSVRITSGNLRRFSP